MFQKVRVGLIGVGQYGSTLPSVINWNGPEGQLAELVAISEVDEQRLTEAGQHCGGATMLSQDYRDLLTNPEIEAIFVATPATVRHPILKALQAGKHVFYEKPLELSLDKADAIIAEARTRKLLCTGNYQWDFLPSLDRIRRMMNDGMIGKPLEICYEGKRRPACNEIMEIGQHMACVAERFAGPIVSCMAYVLRNGRPITADDIKNVRDYSPKSRHLGVGAGDTIKAIYATESGIPITATYLPDEYDVQACAIQINGTKGRIQARGGLLESLFFSPYGADTINNLRSSGRGWEEVDLGLWTINNGDEAKVMVDPTMNPAYKLFAMFAQAIRDGGSDPFPLEKARRILEAVLLPYESARVEGVVKTPLKGLHPLEQWSVDKGKKPTPLY